MAGPCVSIAIPCYEMKGKGVDFLAFSLSRILRQTYRSIEVVISDHSANRDILEFVRGARSFLPIRYFTNTADRGSSSANLNAALRACTGDLVKILFQDDFLFDQHAIQKTVANFRPSDSWLASGCMHSVDGLHVERPFMPMFQPEIAQGKNTISSPSVITVRRSKLIPFDEKLIWMMDCDYYTRLYQRYGPPAILNQITVVNRMWEGQITNSLADKQRRASEEQVMLQRYPPGTISAVTTYTCR